MYGISCEADEARFERRELREENERLKLEAQDWEDEYMKQKRRYEVLDKSALETLDLLKDASSEIKRLKSQLDDALNTLRNIDVISTEAGAKRLAYEAIQRIKGEGTE